MYGMLFTDVWGSGDVLRRTFSFSKLRSFLLLHQPVVFVRCDVSAFERFVYRQAFRTMLGLDLDIDGWRTGRAANCVAYDISAKFRSGYGSRRCTVSTCPPLCPLSDSFLESFASTLSGVSF